MFQFPGFAPPRGGDGFVPAGLPHSEIPGSVLACSSPRLFAACHVLHRRSVPRHPPCALFRLTSPPVIRIGHGASRIFLSASDHESFWAGYTTVSPSYTYAPSRIVTSHPQPGDPNTSVKLERLRHFPNLPP